MLRERVHTQPELADNRATLVMVRLMTLVILGMVLVTLAKL